MICNISTGGYSLTEPWLSKVFGYALKNKKFIVVVPLCITDTARRGELILKKKGLAGIVLKRF
jgi:hypothetical protein